MGSSIDTYFRRRVDIDPRSVLCALNGTLTHRAEALDILRANGGFQRDIGSCWTEWHDKDPTSGRVIGEGPHGFMIDVFEHVVNFSSVERSGMIYLPDSPIKTALRDVICAVARDLGGGDLIIACSVAGRTDIANDVAVEGGSFADIIEVMRQHAGPPATKWEQWETGDYAWYIGAPEAQPDESPNLDSADAPPSRCS